MSNSHVADVSGVDNSLASARLRREAVLLEPLPSWPEKLYWLPLLLFVTFLVSDLGNTLLSKIILSASIASLITLHWTVTSKMRLKIEALATALRDGNH